jgi:hypothetical protein
MSAIEHFRNLKPRKQALLLESDLNRLVLRLAAEDIRHSAARLDSTLATARRFGPWLLPLVSVVGLFAGRRASKAAPRAGWIGLALRYLPVLLRLGKGRTRDN